MITPPRFPTMYLDVMVSSCTCAECGHTLMPADDVWMRPLSLERHAVTEPLCRACGEKELQGQRLRVRLYLHAKTQDEAQRLATLDDPREACTTVQER